MVRNMIQGSLTEVQTANIFLTTALKQQEGFKEDMEQMKQTHACKAGEKKREIKTFSDEINRIKEELSVLVTSAEDYENEIFIGSEK